MDIKPGSWSASIQQVWFALVFVMRKDVHQDLASFMILRTLLLARHFIIIRLRASARKSDSEKSGPVLFYSRRTSSNIPIVLRLG